MKLSVRTIESAKPQDKPYKLTDGGGLYLYVSTTGAKSWRLKYRYHGKEKTLSIGMFPAVTLSQARQKREEAKAQLAANEDPSQLKKSEKIDKKIANDNNFQAIALEWHSSKSKVWSKGYASDVTNIFTRDIFPFLGHRAITSIKSLELLDVLKRIESRGAMETARKARRRVSEVYKYAVVTGRAENNPADNLSIAMSPASPQHYAFLTEQEMPEFLKALDGYSGSVIAKIATQLLMLTGTRTIELRTSKWEQIDFTNKVWSISAEVMKKRRKHIIPLSEQAIVLLTQLKPMTGHYDYIFPGRSDKNKPISENTILGVIRRIGYEGRATGHGFRHQMSTALNEKGFNASWIELQLAHVDKNSIRGTYNHALYLDGRREMMQWYADYIDSLRKL